MKVRYKRDYQDEYGQHFPAGCVAEHTEADCNARVALGVAEIVSGDAYSRRLPVSAPLSFECAPEVIEGQQPEQQAKAATPAKAKR